MRGILSGIMVGAVVSGLALLVIGRLTPVTELSLPAPAPAPVAEAVAVPAGSEFNQERPDTAPVLPGTDGRPGNTETPAVGQPAAVAESLPETTPLATPVTAPMAEAGMTAPAAIGAPPKIEPGAEAAILPDAVAAQPDAPAVDAAPAAIAAVEAPNTAPAPAVLADPQMPPAAPQIEPGADVAMATESAVTQLGAPDVDAIPVPDASAGAPAMASSPAAMSEPMTPAAAPQIEPGADVAMATESAVAQPGAPDVDAIPVPEASAEAPDMSSPPAAMSEPIAPVAAPQIEPGADAAMATESAVAQPGAPNVDAMPAPDVSTASPKAPMTPESMADPSAQSDTPPAALPGTPQGLRLPTAEIEDMTPGITTDRLPSIGAEPDAEPEVEMVVAESALSRNAVYFEAAPGTPVMAVVLVDVGPVRPDPATLADFPLPLTVALDPTAPGAAALMQSYRDAGLEVVILTRVADNAAPAAIAVAFDDYFAAIPQAVAVLDMPEALLQASRPRAAQVVEILTGSGHGLITYDKGLNMALQIASRSGVPSATVFRSIDDGSHDVAAMKRLLDQGAFRAGQDGAVILTAEARPETLTALAEWSLGSRAATVTFAPVSAVLEP